MTLTQRKREGVYYTPEWVTAYVVEQTLGRILADIRRERETLDVHAARIDAIRVLDPACGAGVFLIEALRRILHERRWLAEQRSLPFDVEAAMRATLEHNLYGVDINPESVEITKLALSTGPLAALDHNIRTGNSLIDASFDWNSAFPEVFEQGGFDCILANPPYVKYQHLRKVDATFADHLRIKYESAGAGNFDVYLPFIEKSIRLLNPRGRMGVIAPSLWTKHAYGEGLRRLVRERQCLERWIDFGDFQVFEDATTYTALQFFVGWRSPTISCRLHESVDLSQLEWGTPETCVLPYSSLPERGAWSFVGADDAELLRRLAASHRPLGEFVTSISVGVQTSADAIFHLREIQPGSYRSRNGEVVELESAILRALASGADVGRYVKPEPAARILFPYAETEQGIELISEVILKREFPKAWAYLRRHEATLRAREAGKFDDSRWYRFGRNQNIDKQHLRKLLVPRLVRRLALTPDLEGEIVADNVDVCYLIVDDIDMMWYLLGVLNAAVADWYFRHTSKPFRGGYFSANKQYVAPIPIPRADDEARAEIGQLALQLTGLRTNRSKLEQQLDELVFTLYGLNHADIARVRGG
jgi:methylase of polypeptide subunit release factors